MLLNTLQHTVQASTAKSYSAQNVSRVEVEEPQFILISKHFQVISISKVLKCVLHNLSS